MPATAEVAIVNVYLFKDLAITSSATLVFSLREKFVS